MTPAYMTGVIVVLTGVASFFLAPADPILFWLTWGVTALVGLGGCGIIRRLRMR